MLKIKQGSSFSIIWEGWLQELIAFLLEFSQCNLSFQETEQKNHKLKGSLNYIGRWGLQTSLSSELFMEGKNPAGWLSE